MQQKEEKSASPFSALTFKEQQEKWMAWRSQHLIFEPAEIQEQPAEKEKTEPAVSPVQPSSYPAERAAPTRHGELDRLRARHQTATKNISAWHPTSSTGSNK